MGTCVLGFADLYLIWQISFSENVLHVHCIKKRMHVKRDIYVLMSLLNKVDTYCVHLLFI